jgi:hypothetical protein
LNSTLSKQIVDDSKKASAYAYQLVACNEEILTQSEDFNDTEENWEETCHDGVALLESAMYSLLFTLAACRLVKECDCFNVPEKVRKFCGRWANQLSGKGPGDKVTAFEAISCFYALRHDTKFWSESMRRVASFDYQRYMPFLCDAPTDEVGFYPVFAQLAYPAHNNISETKRFQYAAEGKNTTMQLDVLPFDECRYVYDWLATSQLIDNDWLDESRQLVFRFALDRIAKTIRWYQDDFLFGCHAVGIDDDYFSPPEYSLRERIQAANNG